MKCWEKKAFTKKEAQTARNYQERVYGRLGLSIYECWECGKWHLTSKPQKRRRP